jgi:hypothetical protein
MSGGAMNVWDESQQQMIELQPLAPRIGVPIETVVIVKCGSCGKAVGQVDEWEDPIEGRVECFIGRAFSRARDDRVVASTTYALLTPSHGTDPVTMCPDHGPIKITVAFLRKHQADARYRQRRAAGGQPNGKVTRRVSKRPEEDGWTQDRL